MCVKSVVMGGVVMSCHVFMFLYRIMFGVVALWYCSVVALRVRSMALWHYSIVIVIW